jgi:hypothetical protein
MTKDWGYAALLEINGKRILFDTGDDPAILAKNLKAKVVDLAIAKTSRCPPRCATTTAHRRNLCGLTRFFLAPTFSRSTRPRKSPQALR